MDRGDVINKFAKSWINKLKHQTLKLVLIPTNGMLMKFSGHITRRVNHSGLGASQYDDQIVIYCADWSGKKVEGPAKPVPCFWH